jgi:cation diffusion facilitator family transporter
MSKNPVRKASLINIVANFFLFFIKLAGGIISGSIAVVADAINSFTDIVSSLSVYISVRVDQKAPDKAHPFGHHRAEPIGSLLVAIISAVLGFEIIKIAIERLIEGEGQVLGVIAFGVLLINIIVKYVLSTYCHRISLTNNTPAIKALAIDAFNDIVVSVGALIGVAGNLLGLWYLDPIAAFLIAIWVIRAGFMIAKENIHFLMGGKPEKKVMKEIREKVLSIKGVTGINEFRAHYVGKLIHVEVHVEVKKKLSLIKAHEIGNKVRYAVEAMPIVQRAFIHIDPR